MHISLVQSHGPECTQSGHNPTQTPTHMYAHTSRSSIWHYSLRHVKIREAYRPAVLGHITEPQFRFESSSSQRRPHRTRRQRRSQLCFSHRVYGPQVTTPPWAPASSGCNEPHGCQSQPAYYMFCDAPHRFGSSALPCFVSRQMSPQTPCRLKNLYNLLNILSARTFVNRTRRPAHHKLSCRRRQPASRLMRCRNDDDDDDGNGDGDKGDANDDGTHARAYAVP